MPLALITGGSGGIGLALSREFLQHDYDLLIVSKPEAELKTAKETLDKEFPNKTISTFQKDLSLGQSAKELFQYVQSQNIRVDVLINCAGFGAFGPFDQTDETDELEMIDLNVRCLYHLTKLFLKDMKKRDAGHIINIASLSSFFPSPYLATYAATKAFVLHLGQALHFELKDQRSKVGITTVCPTPVKTSFSDRAKMEQSALFDHWTVVTPERVAKDAFWAMQRNKRYVIPGQKFHWINKIASRLPSSWKLKMAKDSLIKH